MKIQRPSLALKLFLVTLAAFGALAGVRAAGNVNNVPTHVGQEVYAKAKKESAKVIFAFDGDTIQLQNGKVVRLIGIDTPEKGEPYYKAAKGKLKKLVGGKYVLLQKDVTNRDKYGRLLRYVWLGGTLINVEMVRQGYARSYTYPPDVKYQKAIATAQKAAQKERLGLWRCLIKGNISSSGEKIYHVPGGAYYDTTKITASKGERWFCSESEARKAGWRKSKK